MTPLVLHPRQIEIAERPLDAKLFLHGPAGAGKTTVGAARLLHLLRSGAAGRSILVLVPQRTLAWPYYEALHRPGVEAGGQVTVSTLGGLARRMVDLFWPLVAGPAGFAQPDRPPVFLTLETAQYFMARLVRPLLDEGLFESVVIDRNRLYSQILDNLNKSAVVGFPHTQIGSKLKDAWAGEDKQKRIYDDAQACAAAFRAYCLEHNLLDFSLQFELFAKHLWTLPLCRDYLLETYTHLIADNLEEDTPVAHDLLREWLPRCRSALLIVDHDGGYRRFLGADPESAQSLQSLCSETIELGSSTGSLPAPGGEPVAELVGELVEPAEPVEPPGSFVTSPNLQAFSRQLAHSLGRGPRSTDGDIRKALEYVYHRYYPQMLDWVAGRIDDLVHRDHVPPGEIVVLAPYMSDSLRFSLTTRLEERQIPTRSHRPSRALRDESAARCLLTLTALAHPSWRLCPGRYEVVYALVQAIEGMDLVRAQLMANVVYRVSEEKPTLSSFDQINSAMQGRLTYLLGERYEYLRTWLEDYASGRPEELDHFLQRLFGEVLSQPGFNFHRDYDAGQVAANLIESVQKFRWVAAGSLPEGKSLGCEYVEMVNDGVVAAQYVGQYQLQPQDAVLLAPAYTFLMINRPVDVQFWLDIGGRGWWERLYQPLTHPYVLSRHWPPGLPWTDADEARTRQDALYRLDMGLVRRCRQKIYLGLSELGEGGMEQQGPQLQAVQRVLRHLPPTPSPSSTLPTPQSEDHTNV